MYVLLGSSKESIHSCTNDLPPLGCNAFNIQRKKKSSPETTTYWCFLREMMENHGKWMINNDEAANLRIPDSRHSHISTIQYPLNSTDIWWIRLFLLLMYPWVGYSDNLIWFAGKLCAFGILYFPSTNYCSMFHCNASNYGSVPRSGALEWLLLRIYPV